MSQLSLLMQSFRQEAKAKLNTDEIFFLDNPSTLDLGFRVKLLPYSTQDKNVLSRLAAHPLSAKLSEANAAIDKRLNVFSHDLQQLTTHPEKVQVDLLAATTGLGAAANTVSGAELTAQLRLTQSNVLLAEQNKLKLSMLFLQAIKSYFDLFVLMFFLRHYKFDARKLALNHPIFAGVDARKKERLQLFATLMSEYEAGLERMEAIADFALRLCQLRDSGACYGFALYGLDPSMDALQALHTLNPSKSLEELMQSLAYTLSNQPQAALITFDEFCHSPAFLRQRVKTSLTSGRRGTQVSNKEPPTLELTAVSLAAGSSDHNKQQQQQQKQTAEATASSATPAKSQSPAADTKATENASFASNSFSLNSLNHNPFSNSNSSSFSWDQDNSSIFLPGTATLNTQPAQLTTIALTPASTLNTGATVISAESEPEPEPKPATAATTNATSNTGTAHRAAADTAATTASAESIAAEPAAATETEQATPEAALEPKPAAAAAAAAAPKAQTKASTTTKRQTRTKRSKSQEQLSSKRDTTSDEELAAQAAAALAVVATQASAETALTRAQAQQAISKKERQAALKASKNVRTQAAKAADSLMHEAMAKGLSVNQVAQAVLFSQDTNTEEASAASPVTENNVAAAEVTTAAQSKNSGVKSIKGGTAHPVQAPKVITTEEIAEQKRKEAAARLGQAEVQAAPTAKDIAEAKKNAAALAALRKKQIELENSFNNIPDVHYLRATEILGKAEQVMASKSLGTHAYGNTVVPVLLRQDAAEVASSSWSRPEQDVAEQIGLLQALDTSPELMRLKYCMLFGQYFLLNEQSWYTLLRTPAPEDNDATDTAAPAEATAEQEAPLSGETDAQDTAGRLEPGDSADHAAQLSPKMLQVHLTPEQTELQKLKRSLLGAYLQSSAELNIMRQVLTEMVGSAQEQQSTLKMQAAKFNYYAQILGRDFTVIANAQRTAESDRSLVATNLGAYEQNMPVQFILGSMLLSAYNLYFKVNKNTLFDAYEKLHLALPL